MKLSVIIVNYNVEFFLEQCLLSVEKALSDIDSEIWVVDNNSVDYSVRMLKSKFPKVNLILNKENVGFAIANNQAIKKSAGDYILLLNPDTIVEEDTFHKVLTYIDENPETGGLGVKMLDGKGNFLAESKRGLPTPQVAFYKIFGLAKLFPKSKIFGRYHLGFFNKDEIHEVDVLAGAFMLIPKKVLNEIGVLDERFFMYGEDIDLSYRIKKAGYKNIYFPKTSIIHFKGESTKKSSVNYVYIFYRAMILFAQKHFSYKHARLFQFLINIAIYARASIAIISRFIQKIYLPIIEIVLLYAGIYFIQNYWEKTYLTVDAYPWYYVVYVLPTYILIWMLSALLSGAYDRPFSVWKSIKGIGLGTLIILVIYALLPESLRFSRAIILFSTIWAMFSLGLLRWVLGILKINDFTQNKIREKRIAIIGDIKETRRVAELIRNTPYSPGFIGLVNSIEVDQFQEGVIGDIKQLGDLITIYGISELVFCSDSLDASEIIRHMTRLNSAKLAFKIAPHKSSAIIGSQSISQAGNLYMIDIDGILKPNNKRAKRLFDFISALILLIFSPICILFVKRKKLFFSNLFSVLLGFNSWIGYDKNAYFSNEKLPSIKKGILFPKDAFPDKEISTDISARLNLMYSQDYKLKNDLQILLKAFKDLGRNS
ncbi:MAG: glycosyltransferase [Bacteroidales bacterium]|jgi:GT2 family glycosyltransferase|nr:glycosyltransferase [Bacteroidales bacterium]